MQSEQVTKSSIYEVRETVVRGEEEANTIRDFRSGHRYSFFILHEMGKQKGV